jgi:glycerol-3-phosphate dehydrogenase
LEKAFWQFDYGQLKLVFHALEERAHILQNAPQLCNALPTMTPCYEWYAPAFHHPLPACIKGLLCILTNIAEYFLLSV